MSHNKLNSAKRKAAMVGLKDSNARLTVELQTAQEQVLALQKQLADAATKQTNAVSSAVAKGMAKEKEAVSRATEPLQSELVLQKEISQGRFYQMQQHEGRIKELQLEVKKWKEEHAVAAKIAKVPVLPMATHMRAMRALKE